MSERITASLFSPHVNVVALSLAGAMIVNGVGYFWGGPSPTAQVPELASVTVTTAVSLSAVYNLSASFVGGLEPGPITAERPGYDLYERWGLMVKSVV